MFRILNSKTSEMVKESFNDEQSALKHRLSLPNFGDFIIVKVVPLSEYSATKKSSGKKSAKSSPNKLPKRQRVNWKEGPKERLCRINGRWYDGNVRYKPSRISVNYRSIYSTTSSSRRNWQREDAKLRSLLAETT
jgi:hypothetical protein